MSAPAYPTLKVELAFTAGVFTDVTADVALDQGFKFRRGMAGNSAMDRVAATGWLQFSLDNSASNSAHTLGYYSPLNASVRAGFDYGIEVRVSFLYSAIRYYQWRGYLKEIEPVPGRRMERFTRCLALDWMDEAAKCAVRDVALQVAQRSDQVFSAVLAAIARQPAATSVQTGKDTYAYALNDIGAGNHPPASNVFQDIAMSELGYIYIVSDTVQGGTLVFENRQTRQVLSTVLSTLTENDIQGMSVPKSLDRVVNRVELTVHPKTVDATATTVLYSITTQPSLAPGASLTVWGDYRDPTQQLNLVGGTAMVAVVASTDYTANTAADGSGTNMTAYLGVTATYFAATVKFVLANVHPSATLFVTKLQCRGKGLYDYAPVLAISEDTAAEAVQGLRVLQVDQPYQDNQLFGQSAADWLRSQYSSLASVVDWVKFLANDSATMLVNALNLDISVGLVTITESVSGVSSNHIINAVEFECEPSRNGLLIWCTWTLAPASSTRGWILDTAGFSEIGASLAFPGTAYLGYI